jgi:hypothetical protein
MKKLEHFCKNSGKGRLSSDGVLGNHAADTYMSALMALFKYNQEFMENNYDLYKTWVSIHDKIKKPIQNKYKTNEPTDRQQKGYVEYDKIIETRNMLEEGSPERLLLFIYTAIPPARSDYNNMRIYTKKPAKVTEDMENFMVLDPTVSKNRYIVLQDYKTANTYGNLQIDIPKDLYVEIKNSLKQNPRDYLFVMSDGKTPYEKPKSFNTWANRTLKTIINKDFSLTMLRHIYITRRDLEIERMSGTEQEKIAKLMGHSIEQQRKYLWHKLNVSENNIDFDANEYENRKNGLFKPTTSGVKGISWSSNKNKWRVTVDGENYGYFSSLEDAKRKLKTETGELIYYK